MHLDRRKDIGVDTAFAVAPAVTVGSLVRSLFAIGSPVGKTGAHTNDKSSPVHLRPKTIHNTRRVLPFAICLIEHVKQILRILPQVKLLL